MSDSDVERHSDLPFLVVPNVYGLGFHPKITNVSIRYPSQPKPREHNVGKILKKFESDSQRCLCGALWTIVLSINPAENDATWEAYRRWVNSKILKLENFEYKFCERNFCSRFEPAMEVLQLQHAPLFLPAPEIEEEAKETKEASRHSDVLMEDISAQLD